MFVKTQNTMDWHKMFDQCQFIFHCCCVLRQSYQCHLQARQHATHWKLMHHVPLYQSDKTWSLYVLSELCWLCHFNWFYAQNMYFSLRMWISKLSSSLPTFSDRFMLLLSIHYTFSCIKEELYPWSQNRITVMRTHVHPNLIHVRLQMRLFKHCNSKSHGS